MNSTTIARAILARRADRAYARAAITRSSSQKQPLPDDPDIAWIFHQLAHAWWWDTASHDVDVLAAELAALVARVPGRTCVAIVSSQTVERYHGLGLFLEGYGITLLRRHREKGDGVYLYAATTCSIGVERREA